MEKNCLLNSSGSFAFTSVVIEYIVARRWHTRGIVVYLAAIGVDFSAVLWRGHNRLLKNSV